MNQNMWLLGFFLHEMAFGLLSIFLPLYIATTFAGTPVSGLVYLGIMISLAAFLAIPFSFFWGYLCDKTERYKLFILLSFSSMTVLLYFFASTKDIALLIVLYAIIAVAHVAHEPPKNVLIAESYSRRDWNKSFAWYELLTELGWLIGLLLGFLFSSQEFDSWSTLVFCSFLNLLAFIVSAVFVSDPPLIFERGLAGIERTLDFAQRGVGLALGTSPGQAMRDKLKHESLSAFCAGLVLFSLATSTLFTPLPIFFSENVHTLSLTPNLVFAIFVISSAGACAGYFFARKRSEAIDVRRTVKRTALLRGISALSLTVAALYVSLLTVLFEVVVLVLMGFMYALFITSTLSLSMEILPEGKAGLFNVLIGLGGAAGSLLGPLIAASMGFLPVFIASTLIFTLSFAAFRVFA